MSMWASEKTFQDTTFRRFMKIDNQPDDCNEQAVKNSIKTSNSEKMSQDYSIKGKKKIAKDEA